MNVLDGDAHRERISKTTMYILERSKEEASDLYNQS